MATKQTNRKAVFSKRVSKTRAKLKLGEMDEPLILSRKQMEEPHGAARATYQWMSDSFHLHGN